MNLIQYLQFGGPGSGCNPSAGKCGRTSSGKSGTYTKESSKGRDQVEDALEDWAGLDQNPSLLNHLVQKLQAGEINDSAARYLAQLSKQAQSDLTENGSLSAIKVWRVALNTGDMPRQDEVCRSYCLSEKAAQEYLHSNEESYGHKLLNATIKEKFILPSHVVAYYKQSDAFNPEEQEVITSHKPLKI